MDEGLSGHAFWRALYEYVDEYAGDALAGDLVRLLEGRPEEVADIRQAGLPSAHRVSYEVKRRADGYTRLERLYAVSRILDLLLLGFQDGPEDGELPPLEAYASFCAALGARKIGGMGFHPFFHEVVEVRQAEDPGEAPTIVGERWPGYMLGSMLLARSGVVVRAGARHLVAGVADRSTLYWTFRRRSRDTNDLSHGWGHNSQWATDFRRDYMVDGFLHYNVDAALAAEEPDEPELDPAATVQMVRHRCSTTVDHGADLWPYDDHHVEPVPG